MTLSDLLAMLRSQQTPQLGGMAGAAQQVIQSRPYQMHLQESQALGQQPMTPQQWVQQQGMAQPKPRGLLDY